MFPVPDSQRLLQLRIFFILERSAADLSGMEVSELAEASADSDTFIWERLALQLTLTYAHLKTKN